jgi:hypothetical protein
MGTVLVRYFWSELCSQLRTRAATVRLNGNVERGSPRAPWKGHYSKTATGKKTIIFKWLQFSERGRCCFCVPLSELAYAPTLLRYLDHRPRRHRSPCARRSTREPGEDGELAQCLAQEAGVPIATALRPVTEPQGNLLRPQPLD